jgi:1-acyl-sn-glycerol-3-phosphate acyltransferase
MKRPFIWKALQIIARIGTTLLFDLKVFGLRHVPQDGGFLLVSNHQSYIDPVLLGVRLTRPLSYMAKSGLFKFAPFEWLIRQLGAFPIKQGSADIRALKEAIGRVQEGHALTIFPEGTRTPDGTLQPIEPGIALIIRKAKIPVIPAVISGASQAWPVTSKMFHAAPIRVLYGPAIDMTGLDREQIVEVIGKKFAEMFAQLNAGNISVEDQRQR